MKALTKEVQIAIVAILGLIVLFAGLKFLKGMNIFSNSTKYTMVFSDINGMGRTTGIFADGYKVGFVGDIDYNYQKAGSIYVVAEMDKEMQIPRGTKAEINSDLMGNMRVNLIMPKKVDGYLQEGEVIDGRLYSGALDKMAQMVPQIEKMLPKLDSILGSVNALLASPALGNTLNNVDAITSSLRVTADATTQLMGILNQEAPKMLNTANAAMAKADLTMANTERFTSGLEKIDVQGTMNMVNATLASASSAMKKVDQSMADMNTLTANLNSKKGTLGLLLNDDALYTNLNRTVSDADSLVSDLKAHPKRYVHFSIFGRKDK